MYEALVKRLRGLPAESFTFEIMNAMHDAADAIEELQGRAKVLEKVADKWCETVPKWIPVTERLPEQNGKYLAFALKEENMMDFYDGHWMLYGLDYRRYVTHWMRIPEPPKEET